MGLIVNVYKCGVDCTNGGISSGVDALTLINVPGPFNPTPNAPAAMLAPGFFAGTLRIVPADAPGRGMMGGNYAATSDSRFAQACRDLLGGEFYGAVAIHDRFEG